MVESSTDLFPTPTSLFIHLLTEFERNEKSWITYTLKGNEDCWVQVIYSEDICLNFSYRFDLEPDQLLAERGVKFPDGFSVSSWESDCFILVEGPKRTKDEIAATVNNIFQKLYQAGEQYIVLGEID